MWIWRNSNNEPREFKVHDNKRCPICGQYFKKGEKAVAIIPPNSVHTMHKKLSQSFTAHLACWCKFVGAETDDMALAARYIKHRTPKVNPLTKEESKRLNAFVTAAISQGFVHHADKDYGARMTQYRSSLYVEYNVYLDRITIGRRGKRWLFDDLYERQLVADVYNEMHSILKDGKRDEYSVRKVMEDADKFANAMLSQVQ